MYHKMRFRIAAALLAVCVIVAAFPGAALAVDGQTGTTRVADNVPNLDEIVANANDGDVIEIRGQCTVNDNFKGGPWVINKAVTIRGIFGPPDPADPVNGDRIYPHCLRLSPSFRTFGPAGGVMCGSRPIVRAGRDGVTGWE